MRATWYVLEDGNAVDPNDCAPDDKGVLRHKDGVAVAMRGNAYSSRSVDLGEQGLDAPPARDREMKPAASGKGYRTRGPKAD